MILKGELIPESVKLLKAVLLPPSSGLTMKQDSVWYMKDITVS